MHFSVLAKLLRDNWEKKTTDTHKALTKRAAIADCLDALHTSYCKHDLPHARCNLLRSDKSC
jgi:hypothetical protein